MLSLIQIERMIHAGAYDRLIRRVLGNGRCTSRRVVDVLTHPDTSASVALGFAVQRMCELTYGPSEPVEKQAKRLLARRREDGLFGSDGGPILAASAVAVRALEAWTQLMPAVGPMSRGRGLSRRWSSRSRRWRARWSRPGRMRLSRAERDIIRWQLGAHDAIQHALDAQPVGAVAMSDWAGRDELARLARASAA
jgi:hypothetical protein